MIDLSFYLESAALRLVLDHAADFGKHADVVLEGTLHRDYAPRLFIGNEELELQTQDNQTWTPAQRPYVPCFPTVHTHR